MNVLYIGNFLDSYGGWSNASNMWVKALHRAVPNNLAIRYFNYSGSKNQPASHLVKKLMSKSFDKYDIVIQNILPPEMERIDGVYNIGIFYTETDGIITKTPNGWKERIASMDSNWVSTEREAKELERAGLPAEIIPQSIDLDHIKSFTGEPLLNSSGKYRFYIIGAEGDRKNLLTAVVAFKKAFTDLDNVELIIKGSDPDYIERTVKAASSIIPDRNPTIQMLTQSFNDEQMLQLHRDCHCYISASSQESIGRPLMVAATLGNQCIVTDGTSMTEIPNVRRIKSNRSMCVCANPPLPGVYTHYETWFVPDVLDMSSLMRNTVIDARIKQPVPSANNYDYKKVASLISESFKKCV